MVSYKSKFLLAKRKYLSGGMSSDEHILFSKSEGSTRKEPLPSLSKYSVEELLELNSLVCKEIAVRYASLDNELSAMKAGGHNNTHEMSKTASVFPVLRHFPIKEEGEDVIDIEDPGFCGCAAGIEAKAQYWVFKNICPLCKKDNSKEHLRFCNKNCGTAYCSCGEEYFMDDRKCLPGHASNCHEWGAICTSCKRYRLSLEEIDTASDEIDNEERTFR